MRKLPLPTVRVRSVFALCTSTVVDPIRKSRLEAIGPDLEVSETEYERLARLGELYRFLPSEAVGDVSRAEMEWVYTNKLSRRADDARTIYDQLTASTLRCPFCGQRDASTLDHYLAKTVHAHFTVTPMNLVPACKDCNKAKGNRNARTPSEQVLHPYFDDIDAAEWLTATLASPTPLSVSFAPSPPDTWTPELVARITKHFEVFRINTLYSVNATNEMTGIRQYLADLAASGGPLAVQSYLHDMSMSRAAAGRNSWQAALYRAMASTEWFWQGGHQHIGT